MTTRLPNVWIRACGGELIAADSIILLRCDGGELEAKLPGTRRVLSRSLTTCSQTHAECSDDVDAVGMELTDVAWSKWERDPGGALKACTASKPHTRLLTWDLIRSARPLGNTR